MKNSNLVKFSLTLVCAAVLSACGSSGGGSSEPAPVAPTPEVTPTPEPEVTPTPEVDTTGTVTGVTVETEATKTALSYGHKSVKKRDSNFNVGAGQEVSSNSSVVTTGMTIALDPSLDTIVVATSNFQDKTQAAYLEDFDFRGNTDNTTGVHTLEHIYLTVDGSTVNAGEARKDGASRTKTAFQGTQSGDALVYQAGRLNYISTDETELRNEKGSKDLLDRTATVAEVYGNKTFLAGNSAEAQPNEQGKTSIANENLANAPFLHKDANGNAVVGGQLNEVQYGRVTTSLNERKMADFRDGLPVVDGNNTRVASFGLYGASGTEDHYFYRSNTGSRGALDVAALQNRYTSGNIEYNGHAVTYGLDHSFTANNGIPNALGYQKELVSGTHVRANIDLATNNVTGNLYDVWQHGAAGSVNRAENSLVTFNGTLNTANGGISGTSNHKGSVGSLNANVFGANAQELGGAVKSTETAGNAAWGAVFGAAAVQPVQAPVAPVQPIVVPDGLIDATDGNNSTATGR